MKNLFKYSIGVLFAGLTMTACTPDEFEGANPNGIPTVSGIDYQISVDQETNQMVASYTPAAGTYPIWILNGTQYSTLQEVGYNNPEAGTYNVELRLGNRNGISQTGIKKEFTFNETKVDYSADFRRICNKEWRFANREVAHLGCGPAGTAGTEWWSAGVNEKKDFGMYDDRITFTNENRKGGTFTYNAGEDGLTYVNTGTTKWGHQDADWDATIGNQTSSWTFEQLPWTDADGQVTTQQFIKLAANTAFPYISSDEQYENPLFRIETMTSTKLVLVYDDYTANVPTSWRFIFTSEADERFVEESGFDANSDFNLWKGITPTMTFYYNPDPGWVNEQTDLLKNGFKSGDNDYTVSIPQECFAEWQAQVHFHTMLTTSAATNYDFSCILSTDRDIEGVVIKLTNEDDSEAIIDEHGVNLKAGQNYVFWVSDVHGKDLNPVKLVFDFGHATGATNVNISNIVLKDHANDDGTIVPGGGETDVKWVDVNSADNLGRDFNTIGTMEFWWADGGWQQIGNPKFSYNNGVYTIIANDATASEWQAQNSIHHAKMNIEPGQLYDVRAKIESSQDLGRFTFKICDEGDDDNTLIYNGGLSLEAGENYVEFIGVKAQKNGEDTGFNEAKLFIDLGGCPAGLQIDLSEIIVQKHQEGGSSGGALDYNSAKNLWKAVDAGDAFISVTPWFADNGWAQIADPVWSHKDNKWELTLSEGMGGSQWQGQFPINTTLTAAMSDKYDFSCTVYADVDLPGVTIKLTETDDAEKHDNNFFFADRHDVKGGEEFVYTVKGVQLPLNDAHALSLFFDFGGSPAGTHVEISNIIFQKSE